MTVDGIRGRVTLIGIFLIIIVALSRTWWSYSDGAFDPPDVGPVALAQNALPSVVNEDGVNDNNTKNKEDALLWAAPNQNTAPAAQAPPASLASAPAPSCPPAPAPVVATVSCYDRPLEDRTLNPIWVWLNNYSEGPGVHKYHQYIDAYNRHFAKYKNGKDKIYMAEVGVQSGGSIEMWRAYFGPDRLVYYGFDINRETKQFEREGVTITLGDQGNRSFWQDVKRTLPPLDIFVDDGGHSMRQQIVTFEEMFPHVKDGGTYLCEDTHTSYWPKLEGGYRKEGTWIEYSKKFVDTIHLGPSKKLNLTVGDYTKHIRGLFFYDSMVFFEKAVTSALKPIRKGNKWIP